MGILNTITQRALCAFRSQRADDSRMHWAQMANHKGSDMYWIEMDKSLNAARDSHAAHAELGCSSPNPCDVWDDETIAMIAASMGDRAEVAYAAAEAEMENLSLRKFHEEAFE